MSEKTRSLYIHIPFCDSICSYCDFPKLLNLDRYRRPYLDRLKEEISEIPSDELDTVYFGGGTPSSLTCEEIEELLSFVTSKFKINEEFSFECNPESLTLDKIKILAKYGVNRVSIGVQTIDDEALSYLNRHHSKEDVTRCVKELQSNGITNINLDFIYGIKYDSFEKCLNNIEFATSLGVTHISYYALQFEEGTKLFKDRYRIDEDHLADYYDFVRKELEKRGYYRYEVSNFSKIGYESKHNLAYWHQDYYYACGLGAASYVDERRLTRTTSIVNYIDKKNLYIEDETCTLEDKEFNFLMCNLRLENGFSKARFKKLFNKDFETSYKEELENLKDYFIVTNDRIRVKKEDIYILDSLLVDLLHFN